MTPAAADSGANLRGDSLSGNLAPWLRRTFSRDLQTLALYVDPRLISVALDSDERAGASSIAGSGSASPFDSYDAYRQLPFRGLPDDYRDRDRYRPALPCAAQRPARPTNRGGSTTNAARPVWTAPQESRGESATGASLRSGWVPADAPVAECGERRPRARIDCPLSFDPLTAFRTWDAVLASSEDLGGLEALAVYLFSRPQPRKPSAPSASNQPHSSDLWLQKTRVARFALTRMATHLRTVMLRAVRAAQPLPPNCSLSSPATFCPHGSKSP